MSTSSKRQQFSDSGTLPFPKREKTESSASLNSSQQITPDPSSSSSSELISPMPAPREPTSHIRRREERKEERTGTEGKSEKEKRATLIVYNNKRKTMSYSNLSALAPNTATETPQANENVTLMYSEREIETIKEIFQFIVQKEPKLLQEMFDLKLAPVDDLIETLLTLSFATNTPLKLIRYFLENDFEANKQEGGFLRDNGIASKLIKAYTLRVGQGYIQELLGDFMGQMVNHERKISFEINPSFTDLDEKEKNLQLLIAKMTLLLDKMTSKSAVDKMPPGIRVVAGYIAEYANKYCPKNLYPLVGGFIVLRFINPSILSPEEHDIVPNGKKVNSIIRRNLTLLSKILQNLSSGIEFTKKDEFMTTLNGYIQNKKREVMKYFDDIIVPIDAPVAVPSELNVVTVKDLHTVHRILFHKQNHFATLISDNNLGDFGSLLDKLGTYQSKVSFSFLSAADRKAVKTILEERHEEASFINWVDKKKRNKIQKRLLIIGMNRIISVKPNGKIAREGHALDLVEVKSIEPKEIELVFKTFKIMADSDQADEIITSIRRAYDYNFSGMPENLKFKLTVQPTSRIGRLPPSQEGPCGGFVSTYRSLCDYYAVPPSNELCWDVDNLYEQENQNVFNFSKMVSEFENPLTEKDLLPLFHALRYNTYFTGFVMRDFKLEKQTFFRFAEFLASNTVLTLLTLSNVMGPREGLINLFEAMANNTECKISSIDVSNTVLEDKGMLALCTYLKKTSVPLTSLDITNTSCSPKILVPFFASMQDNSTKHLQYFGIGNFKFGAEGSTAFWQYLITNSPSIDHVSIANSSQASMKIILDGLVQKSNVHKFDLSGSKLSKHEDAAPLIDFVQKSGTLQELNLSSTFIPNETLQQILSSFNNDLNVVVSLSNNNLSFSGAEMLSKIAYKLTSVTVLDLSDNDLGDEGVGELCIGLRNNFNIKRLLLNRTIKSGKTKARSSAIDNLIKLISSESAIEALHLNMSKATPLKHDLIPFLNALASNSTITELDISGNQMGNKGAIALAKSLQSNNSLVRLYWDDNQTGYLGFRNIKHALKINRTMKFMPLPMTDVANMLVTETSAGIEPAKLQSTLRKIEQSILRNQING